MMPTPHSKPILGVVGAIGAGKSTIARLFAAEGGTLIEGDPIGHMVLEQPAIRDTVIEQFGDDVANPDGTIDRRKLGKKVFDNDTARKALEAIVFPAITQIVQAKITLADADPASRFIVLDAAVMLEAGWRSLCNRLIYVDAARELREARVLARSGWTPDELTRREAAQMLADDKKRYADKIIVNDGPPDSLIPQVARWTRDWFSQ